MAPVLAVMDMLMSVAYRDFTNVLEEAELTEQASHLVHLLCSLQTSLLVWVHQQTEGQSSSMAEEVLVRCKSSRPDFFLFYDLLTFLTFIQCRDLE